MWVERVEGGGEDGEVGVLEVALHGRGNVAISVDFAPGVCTGLVYVLRRSLKPQVK